MDRGEIWAAIRSELPKLREQMKLAVESEKYEIESAYLDGIARRLANAVHRLEHCPAEQTKENG